MTGREKKIFALGFLFCIFTLAACASTLKYPYFGMGMDDRCFEEGTLLGVDGKGEFDPDLNEPMTKCRDFACVVEKVEVRERLEADLESCQIQLEDCQKTCPRS